MHRPGIASVYGDRILLDGTTIEEVEKYHRDTLTLSVEAANKATEELAVTRWQEQERQRQQSEQHRQHVEDAARRIKFE
jgi:hypothetical protein